MTAALQKRIFRSLALTLACVAFLAAMTGCRVNPVTGEQQLNFVSRQQALSLGDEQHPKVVKSHNGKMEMSELNRYLTDIVMRLHSNSHTPDMPVDFTLLNSSVVNAFALPGHVYATRGFVAKVDNEAQFAAVMGHELAHVSAGHVAQQMSRQTLSSLGVSLAGVALGGDTAAAQGAMQAAKLGTGLVNLSYSRAQERQADRAGTYYAALAGWEPREALEMQKKIHDMEDREQAVLAKYLSTHPPLRERLSAIKSAIREKDMQRHVEGDGVFKERWEKKTAELEKIHEAYQPYDEGEEALSNGNAQKALKKAEEALSMRKDQAPFYRLKGDALQELGRTEDARKAYRRALELDEDYVDAEVGLGRLDLQQGRNEQAVRRFEAALDEFPSSVAAHWGRGQAKMNLDQYGEAADSLERVASAVPKASQPHYLLAVCYERTGQPVKAFRQYRRAVSLGLSGDRQQKARQRMQELESELRDAQRR